MKHFGSKNRTSRRLALKRETLRNLHASELAGVGGGFLVADHGTECPICNTKVFQ